MMPDDRYLALAYAKVHTRTMSATLTKAQRAGTEKHCRDLAESALADARGIVAALEAVVNAPTPGDQQGPDA